MVDDGKALCGFNDCRILNNGKIVYVGKYHKGAGLHEIKTFVG